MIDILQRIFMREISDDQAYEIYEELIIKHNRNELDIDPLDELVLNEYEKTAFAFGIDLGKLAKWRYKGWPDKCSRCGAKIDYKNYGWMIIDDKLVGLNCCK